MSKRPTPKLLEYYYRLIELDLIRFLIVGGCGFVVNFVSLALFYDLLKLPILAAQLIGAELALLTTFAGNNFWAFRGHGHHSIRKKIIKFHVSAWVGVGINSAIVVSLVRFGHVYYGFALAAGSIVALVWNYILNTKFVFKKQPENHK